MKRILFDTNVVLDVLLDRQPHAPASAAAWAAAEGGRCTGVLTAHAVTTIHYMVRKELGEAEARRVLSAMLGVFEVAPVDGLVIREALQLAAPDFEDAVTAAGARAAGCDWIITRDLNGFAGSPVRVLPPEAMLALSLEP